MSKFKKICYIFIVSTGIACNKNDENNDKSQSIIQSKNVDAGFSLGDQFSKGFKTFTKSLDKITTQGTTNRTYKKFINLYKTAKTKEKIKKETVKILNDLVKEKGKLTKYGDFEKDDYVDLIDLEFNGKQIKLKQLKKVFDSLTKRLFKKDDIKKIDNEIIYGAYFLVAVYEILKKFSNDNDNFNENQEIVEYFKDICDKLNIKTELEKVEISEKFKETEDVNLYNLYLCKYLHDKFYKISPKFQNLHKEEDYKEDYEDISKIIDKKIKNKGVLFSLDKSQNTKKTSASIEDDKIEKYKEESSLLDDYSDLSSLLNSIINGIVPALNLYFPKGSKERKKVKSIVKYIFYFVKYCGDKQTAKNKKLFFNSIFSKNEFIQRNEEYKKLFKEITGYKSTH